MRGDRRFGSAASDEPVVVLAFGAHEGIEHRGRARRGHGNERAARATEEERAMSPARRGARLDDDFIG